MGCGASEIKQAEVCLALAEVNAGEDLVHGFVQGQLYGEVVLYPRDLCPRGLLTGEQAPQHELGRRVAQDLWKVCIRNSRKNSNVARVSLVQNRSGFGHCVGKHAHLREHLETMQSLSFCEVGHVVHPTWAGGKGRILLHLCTDGLLFLCKKRHDVRIDLRYDEVVDVEHLS